MHLPFQRYQNRRRSALNVNDVRRSISLTIPTIVDPDNGKLPHLLAIFHSNFRGKWDDSWDYHDFRDMNDSWGEPDQPDI
jgi:hypothetical protein